MKKPPVKAVKREQKFLLDYLAIDLDIEDFSGELPRWVTEERQIWDDEPPAWSWGGMPEELRPRFTQWLQDEGIDLEGNWDDVWDTFEGYDLSRLPPELRESFALWLKKSWIPSEWRDDPSSLPAYLAFDRDPKALPTGTWCVHFTNADPFDRFDRGTTLEGLHLSTWKKNKDFAECPANISGDIGSGEVVYGFSFAIGTQGNILRSGRQKYGRHAVLFQTDGAVLAHHIGDSENQAIFPLCSEYNVIPIHDPDPEYGFMVDTDGGEIEFGSLEDVIAYVESEEPKEHRVTRNGPRLLRGWA